jgi:hypothetical protein
MSVKKKKTKTSRQTKQINQPATELEKIDKYFEQISLTVENPDTLSFNFVEDNNNNTLQVYKDGKLYLKLLYDTIGLYDPTTYMFYWGWAVDLADKRTVKNSERVKKYAEELKPQIRIDTPDKELLHYYGTTNAFMIKNEKNILLPIKMMAYVMKAEKYFIVPQPSNTGTSKNSKVNKFLQFVTVSKIIDSY